MDFQLHNNTILVTGASSGIGQATADVLRQCGATVIVTARDQEALEKVAEGMGESVHAMASDVRDLASLDTLYARIKEEFGTLDGVVANAGVGNYQPMKEFSEAEYDQVVDTNMKGVYFTIQKALPLLAEGSSVVLTASVDGMSGHMESSVYGMTKAALILLTKNVAREQAGRGIRVNSVSPGPIKTAFFEKIDKPDDVMRQMSESLQDIVMLSRMGEPKEVANVISFLLSPLSSYMTAENVTVDGGMSHYMPM